MKNSSRASDALIALAIASVTIPTAIYALTGKIFLGIVTGESVLPHFGISGLAFLIWCLWKWGRLVRMRHYEIGLMILYPILTSGAFFLWLLWSEQ